MPSDIPTRIDYVELTSPRLEDTQAFLTKAFGWSFIDYGPDYRDLQDAGLGGGIARGAACAPLVIVYAADLEAMLTRVQDAGAQITKEIFSFPGGRRFQFLEPGGTEMAVWTKD